MIQGSEQWFSDRLGKSTASRINDVRAKLKGNGEAATRRNYRAQLVCERLTGQKAENFCSPAMQWGTDNEPSAREAYEFITGNKVEQVGFIDHPFIENFGASPDGTVGNDGLLEIKCPNTATHIEWMLAGVVPSEHVNQMRAQMACTGRKWVDFVSYDPRMPIELQLFIKRLHFDEKENETLLSDVTIFLKEVDEMVEKLNELRG